MQMTLRDILTKEWFEKVETVFSSRYDLMLESVDSDGREIRSLSGSPCHPYFCRLIRDSRPATARCYKDRVRWMDFAQKSGRSYIGLCHAGIVLGCVPVVYRGKRLGGMFFGKCLPDTPDRQLRQEFRKRFKGFRFHWNSLSRAKGKLNVVSESQLVTAGQYLQSQLNQVLIPKKVAALRKQKVRRLAEKARKQEQLKRSIPQVNLASRIRPAIEYMDYHYDLPIKLKSLAQLSGLSVFRFAHLFREQTGVTPVEYLTRVRIGHAMRLLTTTDWDFRQIMESTGYTYQSYFIRMFKRVTGTTPQQYRDKKNITKIRKVRKKSHF
jgi:AraC-like DNA-binding protein/ligand-binding sensor protein